MTVAFHSGFCSVRDTSYGCFIAMSSTTHDSERGGELEGIVAENRHGPLDD
jgi:hypothetical protein